MNDDVKVPEASDAEQAVLGALMVDSDLVPVVSKILTRDHFHATNHAALYDVITRLHAGGSPIDKVSVASELRRRNTLGEVGGIEYLTELLNSVPTTASVEYYAGLVADAHQKRALIRIGTDLVAASSNGLAPSEVAKSALDRLSKIEVSSRLDDQDIWVFDTQERIFIEGVAPIEWDFEGLIQRDIGPTMIFGDPDSFKTWIALHLTACSVTGEPAFGFFRTNQRERALYVNFDAGSKAFSRRTAMLGKATPNLLVCTPSGGYTFAAFKRTIEDNPGSFMALDCLADMYVPKIGAEPGADMRGFLKPLRSLYEQNGISGPLIDHTGRGRTGAESYYGSVQKKATLRAMIHLERTTAVVGDPKTVRVKLTCAKPGEAERFRPFYVDIRFTETAFSITYGGYADERVEAAIKLDGDYGMVAATLANGAKKTKKQLLAETGLSRDRVTAALRRREIGSTGDPHSPNVVYYLTAGTSLDAMAEQAGLDLADPAF